MLRVIFRVLAGLLSLGMLAGGVMLYQLYGLWRGLFFAAVFAIQGCLLAVFAFLGTRPRT